MEETWASRDLPVLRAVVEAFDVPDRYKMSHAEIEEGTGLDSDDVKRALRALWEAEPAYIKGTGASSVSYPLWVLGVTERARVAAGQWPKPEDLVDALAKALEDAAESAEPDERSRLQRAAEVLRGTAKEVAIQSHNELGRANRAGALAVPNGYEVRLVISDFLYVTQSRAHVHSRYLAVGGTQPRTTWRPTD